MRCHEDVVERGERGTAWKAVSSRIRVGVPHVNCGTRKCLVAQGGEQRVLVNNWTAGNIDYESACPQQVQLVGTNESRGLGEQWDAHNEDVASRQGLVQICNGSRPLKSVLLCIGGPGAGNGNSGDSEVA